MNKEDKDIFDFMNSLSEEESMKLLEDMNLDDEELSDEQKDRIKNYVKRKLNVAPVKRNYKLGKGLIAASVAALLIFTGFTPPGQRAVAEIIKKLYFIPGVGQVQESDGQKLYVLPKPVKASYSCGEIVVKSALRDKTSLSIGFEGNNYINVEDFKKIYITDDNGKTYDKPGFYLGSGSDIWSGSLFFNKVPEDMNSFDIILSDKSKIHITLSLAESFEDYTAMGPTDVKNDLGITLVPVTEEGKIKFNLVQHPSGNRKVDEYGQQVDPVNYGKIDITVKDDLGRQYELDHPKQYSSPLSEFYIVPKEDAKNYTVEIPEVTLLYKKDVDIKLPVPKEGEIEVNKDYDINGFTLTVEKVVRIDNRIRIYVDTNYDNSKAENLSLLHLEAVNSDKRIGYSWDINRNNRTVEYFELEVEEKSKNITLTFSEFYTILKGPWKFQF